MKKMLHILFACCLIMIAGNSKGAGPGPLAKSSPANWDCADTHEYNDVIDSATAISIGAFVSGRIETEDDVDWYKFTLTSSGSIQINIDNLPTTEDDPDEYMVELYSPTGAFLFLNSYEFDLPSLHIYYYGAAAGTYYARIYRASWTVNISPNCYHMVVNTQPSPGVCSESYEPNNSLYTPPEIPVDTEVLSMLSPGGDIDFYKFTTTAPNTSFTVVLRNVEPRFNINLYSDSTDYYLELGLSSTRDFEDSAEINFDAWNPATYHLEVRGYYGATLGSRCYSVIIKTRPPSWRKAPPALPVPKGSPDPNLRVYPVPTSGAVYMEQQSAENKMRYVTVSDLNGRIVYSKMFRIVQGTNRLEIILPSAVPNGTYIVSDGEQARKVILRR